MLQIPVSNISESVYKTSVDWINQRSTEALGSFVMWSLDSIFADLASQQPSGKGAKKAVQQTTSKSQVSLLYLVQKSSSRKKGRKRKMLYYLNTRNQNLVPLYHTKNSHDGPWW